MQQFNSQLLIDFTALGEKIFPKFIFGEGLFAVNDSVISGFIVVAVILLAALIMRLTIIRKWKTTPTGGQMFLEWLVCTFDKQAEDSTENYASFMGPYTFGAAAYILLRGSRRTIRLRPAMADVGACLSLAFCTFFVYPYARFREEETQAFAALSQSHQHHHGYRRACFHDRPVIRQYFKRYGDHGTRIYSRRGDLVRGASAHYSRPRFAAVHAVPRVYTGVRVRLAHVDVRAGSDRRGTEKAKEKEEKARRRRSRRNKDNILAFKSEWHK